jgi:Spy/CpxP family protein refolding chaperone
MVFVIGLVTVLATGVSFSLAHWMARRTQPPTTANIHDPAWLKRELTLSDSQAREIEKLETAFRATLDSACAAHCAARRALGEQIAKPQPDVEKCRACVEKMNAVQADAERATLDHILQVRALLDEQQAQRYSSIIHQQVCNMPMGAP